VCVVHDAAGPDDPDAMPAYIADLSTH
jgi:hypothetical protein